MNRRRYKVAEACNTCKRRKERCDGNKPCGRCTQRRVEAECQYRPRQKSASAEEERNSGRRERNSVIPDYLSANATDPMAVPMSRVGPTPAPPTSTPPIPTSVPPGFGQHQGHNPGGSDESDIRRSMEPGYIPASGSTQTSRQAAGMVTNRAGRTSFTVPGQVTFGQNAHQSPGSEDANALARVTSHSSSASAITGAARLLQDTKGTYMFLGDSANLSLLQTMRNLIGESIGKCPFVDDPHREHIVESAPSGAADWMDATAKQPPPKPEYNHAVYLIRRYTLATECVLNLFDEGELLAALPRWLDRRSKQERALDTVFFLVFAIGAHTCPEDQDALANLYFDHGRYLTASILMEDPSIATVQAYAMITMYLVGASRRNAAFMYLGTAVRAAYALGLHRSDVANLFPPAEVQSRERLWKSLRTLDLFLSASLGRPPSTEETRDTENPQGYSATIDICAIFEQVLTDVYAKRMITTDTVQKISERHRRWTARLHNGGLEADGIKSQEAFDDEHPNIALMHLKEAYYWTIILLTRPFFVEWISKVISQRSQANGDGTRTPSNFQSSDQVLVHACVNSAICTLNMLKVLLTAKEIPKRLPFVVNSLFVSGLVLGLAYFGDLYKTYPLEEGLGTALRILKLFPHDDIAKRNAVILDHLLDACNIHVRRQKDEAMARHAHLVSGMFGQMDGTQRMARDHSSTTMHARNNMGSIDPALEPSSQHAFHNMPLDNSALGTVDHSGNEVSDLNSNNVHSGASLQQDYWMLPEMSPRTLWFGPYEDNMPLYSTVDARAFM